MCFSSQNGNDGKHIFVCKKVYRQNPLSRSRASSPEGGSSVRYSGQQHLLCGRSRLRSRRKKLPLRGSWHRKAMTERARMLIAGQLRSDSIALTEGLLIAAWQLCPAGLALSVCFAATSPIGRGFCIPQSPRLPLWGQRRRPPPAAGTGRSCWGSGQQDASDSEADAGCRNPGCGIAKQ